MTVLFMGTPDFASFSLQRLAETETVLAVVTQPDKPQGRKMTMTPPSVKVAAQSLGIPVYQPETLRGYAIKGLLEELKPEVIVVAAYGKILPPYVLNYPKFGCVNVHGSLLPKYRGAAPVQWAVLNGDEETGITTMLMDKGIDTGDMLLKRSIAIGEYETSGELFDRMAELGADVLMETIAGINNGTVKRVKQPEEGASYAPMLDKSLSHIDFSKTTAQISKQICGLNPWPIAQVNFKGKTLKILRAVKGGETLLSPGFAVQAADKTGIEAACGDKKSILLTEVQLEGTRAMSAREFLTGHPLPEPVDLRTE